MLFRNRPQGPAAAPRRRAWQPRPNKVLKWALEDLSIGVRLRLVFACILLLMVAGGAGALWQFHEIRYRIREVSLTERRATAVMRMNNSAVLLMSRLLRAGDSNSPAHFEIEAKRLLAIFHSETVQTSLGLRTITPKTGRQRVLIDSVNDMLNDVPRRVASMMELARAGDWVALHARLTDQVDHSDEVGDQLMRETIADLAEARRRLFADLELAERRAVQTLVFSSLLSVFAAGVLLLLVTRSITRPLSALDRGAKAIARGDFHHEIAVMGADELAHLAKAFNSMTRELATLYARESEARKTAEHLNQTLRRANNDLSVFAYSASHDLQEPLRNIVAYSQMLQRNCNDKLDSEAKEFIGYLVEGAGRMSELIDDLLVYMEISSGENGIVARIPAAAAIESALSTLRTAVVTTDATITFDNLPAVAIKPIHFQQLFQNLIGNAIKYRSDRPPVVRISATELDHCWQFSVADNGIGVDPQYREQIFRPFQRLHCRSQYPGTGIGLAICQKIVERYGGQIWIESALGHGSDFRFTLPKR